MTDKSTCCVLPRELMDSPRIKDMQESLVSPCQFEDKLKTLYECDGEHFCILHLPRQSECNQESYDKREMDKKKNNSFFQLLKSGHHNFSYVDLVNIKIDKLHDNSGHLVFSGAKLRSLVLKDLTLDHLLVNGAELRGVTEISNCIIRTIQLKNSFIYKGMHFKGQCKINLLIMLDSHIKSSKGIIRPGGLCCNVFELKDSTINQFFFRRGSCELEFRLHNSSFDKIEIADVRFHQCPSFNVMDLSKVQLNIPEEKNVIDLKKLDDQFRKHRNFFCYLKSYGQRSNRKLKFISYLKQFFKKKQRVNEQYNELMSDQYKKTRDIYNICRDKKMYDEQSTYFGFMQKCLRKTNKLNKFYKGLSWCYEFFSYYGQSVLRPLISLFSLFIIFGVIFSALSGSDFQKSLMFSLNNIVLVPG